MEMKSKTYYEHLLGNYFRFRYPHFEIHNDIVTSQRMKYQQQTRASFISRGVELFTAESTPIFEN